MNHRLAEQISYLLLRHHYVVVPQLGGFIREALPASYHRTQGLAYPPSAELHFNQELQHSDGLLEARYALLLGISMRRARLLLEDEVKQLRHALIQRGQYQLPLIGTLELSSSGKLSFTPLQQAKILSSSAYGLGPLSLPLLQHKAQSRISSDLLALSEETQAQQTQAQNSSDYIQLRLPKRALGYATSIIILLLCLLPQRGTSNDQSQFQAGFMPTKEAAEALWGKVEAKVQPAEQSTEVPTPQAPKGLQWASAGDGRYYVIIATERSEVRLLNYYEEAKETLEAPEDLLGLRSKHGPTVRLAAAVYDDAAAAYSYLNSLVKQHKAYSSSWVFYNK